MNAVPPKLTQKLPASPAGARPAVVVLALAGALGGTLVFFFNPATHHFYPVCQFHQLTGLDCPGCGMTRALYALLHGHFSEAMRDNALLVGAMAVGIIRGGWFGWNQRRGKPKGDFFSTKLLWPLVAVIVFFTVLRNLPAFSFLSPP